MDETTTVAVGSTNPVKVEAARRAFGRVFPGEDHEVEGLSVGSGVPDQPRGEAQTREGARNRAEAVAGRRPDADYRVGIEGGVSEEEGGLYAFAWIVVRSADRSGEGVTGRFRLPEPVARRVRAGRELGAADDEVFGTSGSKRDEGAVGLLTAGAVSRTELYAQGACLALAPFVHPELYAAVPTGRAG